MKVVMAAVTLAAAAMAIGSSPTKRKRSNPQLKNRPDGGLVTELLTHIRVIGEPLARHLSHLLALILILETDEPYHDRARDGAHDHALPLFGVGTVNALLCLGARDRALPQARNGDHRHGRR